MIPTLWTSSAPHYCYQHQIFTLSVYDREVYYWNDNTIKLIGSLARINLGDYLQHQYRVMNYLECCKLLVVCRHLFFLFLLPNGTRKCNFLVHVRKCKKKKKVDLFISIMDLTEFNSSRCFYYGLSIMQVIFAKCVTNNLNSFKTINRRYTVCRVL